ncbi:outer membrane beta-barrel protein [Seonamhaeicola sp. ML3]|uniref:outer membrane beta-barrel protein n=1 Tax=Seonamhaeicola sp. ML3 TaxID=2937786 RepID=UPI00200F8385|nr:outer membrane beta-barrel protein [Seonamhaeicola sp. ML3]
MKYFIPLLLLIFTNFSQAQDESPNKQNNFSINIGYAFSQPYEGEEYNHGGNIQLEYKHILNKFIDIRPYFSLMAIKSNSDDLIQDGPIETATMTTLLIGGKTRIKAPLKWFAPYFEIGIGASYGSFKTISAKLSIKKTGLFYHIPASVGVELGPKNNINLALNYYYHPNVEQKTGIATIGFSLKLK